MNEAKPDQQSEPQPADPIDLGPETAAAQPAQDIIKVLEVELAELKDRLLRAVAETDNVRKRAERERTDAVKYAIAPFARDLIPVADNLARAQRAVPADQLDNATIRALSEGISMVERELLAAFERHGLKRITPKGEPFNPNYHQAVAEVPAAPGTPSGTIVEVIEAGYVIDERLIRPALVVIAKAAENPAPQSAPGSNLDTSA